MHNDSLFFKWIIMGCGFWLLRNGGQGCGPRCCQGMGAFVEGLGFWGGVSKKIDLADAQKPVVFKPAHNAFFFSPVDIRERILYERKICSLN